MRMTTGGGAGRTRGFTGVTGGATIDLCSAVPRHGESQLARSGIEMDNQRHGSEASTATRESRTSGSISGI